MDKNAKLVGAALAALAMAAGCSGAAKKTGSSAAVKGECWGVNSCKGQGECGGVGHSCAGKNACKGKGWLALFKADCDSKGGKFKDQ